MLRSLHAILVCTSVLVVAACGSQLDPDEVGGAGGPVAGATGGSTGALPGGTDAAPLPGSGVGPLGAVGEGGTDVGSGVVTGADGSVLPPTQSGPGPGAGDAPTGDQGGGPPQPGAGEPTATGGPGAPSGDPPAADCAGLENTTGITETTITVGNASDLSGPQPGLFQAALDGVNAYATYFNATSDICGRKLAVRSYDSKTDGGGNQAAYVAGCEEVFAMVGSASGFDSGGAAAAEDCGLPDLNALMVTAERQGCRTCFGASSTNAAQFQNAIPDLIKQSFGGGQHAAMFYLDAGAARENGLAIAAAGTKRGLKYDLVQAVGVGDFNYAPYVQQLKEKKIESVQFVGASSFFVRMTQAMEQGGYTPRVFLLDFSAYDAGYVEPAGSSGDDTVVFTSFTPFEEAQSNPEMQLYLSYLQQARPGASPSYGGVFAWSAARLFVEQARALGGRLTRASLISALGRVEKWTSGGIHSAQNVGSKVTSDCWRFLQLDGGRWSPFGGTKYRCNGLTLVG